MKGLPVHHLGVFVSKKYQSAAIAASQAQEHSSQKHGFQ
jgi:hypothetical protein